jgi:peptidoglycan/LPS O-acetylase OafA/YrhL
VLWQIGTFEQTLIPLRRCTSDLVLKNLAMLPIQFMPKDCRPIPQAWSLSLEVFFYFVIPFIVIWGNKRSFAVVVIASLCIFFVAYLGIINTDEWGYRRLPGALFMFLAGAAMASP